MKKTDKDIINIPTLNEQKSVLKRQKSGILEHNSSCVHEDSDQIPDSWKPFKQGYVPPSAAEIRQTFSGFSSAELANMLGLSDGRIIRRWKSGENEIPYAAWRLFLILTERVILK